MKKNSKKVFIAGAAGFIGRFAARHFSEQGWTVLGIDSIPAENAPVTHLGAYRQLYLPDTALHALLKEHSPQVFINCAGRSSVPWSLPNPAEDFISNTVLTYQLLDACRVYSPGTRFITISSAAVYGNPKTLPVREDADPAPVSPYGYHKLQSEIICREFHEIYALPSASVRIFSAYGPGLRRQVLWDICRKALSSREIILQGTGRESRDFIHAHDIARALLVLAQSAPMQGETYNLASGQETTISDLSSMLMEALEHVGGVTFDGQIPAGTPLNWKANISKISALGFSTSIPLRQGAAGFAVWCRSELTHP